MRIMLNMPPIRKLIAVMRYLVSASRPKDTFQSQEESQITSYKKRFQTKTPQEVDHLKYSALQKNLTLKDRRKCGIIMISN